MDNPFVVERLGQERLQEALREAEQARTARLAEPQRTRDSFWRMLLGKVMPDAAGAWEVPSL